MLSAVSSISNYNPAVYHYTASTQNNTVQPTVARSDTMAVTPMPTAPLDDNGWRTLAYLALLALTARPQDDDHKLNTLLRLALLEIVLGIRNNMTDAVWDNYTSTPGFFTALRTAAAQPVAYTADAMTTSAFSGGLFINTTV